MNVFCDSPEQHYICKSFNQFIPAEPFLLHGWPDSTACIHRSSSTSAALFRHASYMFCLWLRFIFCPLQLCHFEGVLGSCFTLSLSLAPACCTERIDFSRWSNQLSASSSDTKETQKEKEATTTNPFSCIRRTRKTSENDLLLGLVPIG